jgi:glyceraldehyde 3-phosphate dehydrogenase
MTLLSWKSFLLRYDSIHGDFQGSVVADPDNNTIINGTVHISLQQFKDIDYTLYDIDNALLDNTGAFTTSASNKCR